MFCIQCAPVFVRIVCEATVELCLSVGSSDEQNLYSMSAPSLYNIQRVFRGDQNIHGVFITLAEKAASRPFRSLRLQGNLSCIPKWGHTVKVHPGPHV